MEENLLAKFVAHFPFFHFPRIIILKKKNEFSTLFDKKFTFSLANIQQNRFGWVSKSR